MKRETEYTANLQLAHGRQLTECERWASVLARPAAKRKPMQQRAARGLFARLFNI